VNLLHRWLCSSSRWRQTVEKYVLPWTLEGLDLGSEVVEIGPGYGVTTDLLRVKVAHLTCVEVDEALAQRLRHRTRGLNVTVRCEDASALSLPDAAFDAAVCFTMLHHVRSAEHQDRLLAQVARVLRPGGIFAGTDSLDSRLLRLVHLFDTMVVVDPGALPDRLSAAGFQDVKVDVNPYAFRFRARKPLTARAAA
jgi:SAM-dependent methyltransferase